MIAADAKKPPPKQRAKQQAKKDRIKARERFRRAHIAEKKYGRQLKSVAAQVGAIVRGIAPNGIVTNLPLLSNALHKYSEMLRPWAQAVGQSMVSEVSQRDEQAWTEMGKDLGRNLRHEIRFAPTGKAFRELMDEQVDLITSIPIEAAQRVHGLVIGAMSGGTRAKETAKEILKTEDVTKSRAMLIARTETTRAATAMTQARAVHIGSEGYIWRTARDSDVRDAHKKLEGKFFRWDDPPVAADSGERSHPGMIYNCRCYPEVIIPDDL